MQFGADGRDARILRWVHACRFLTREQLHRLEFPPASTSYVKRRLMLFYQHAYLERLAVPQIGPFGSPRLVYALDTRGAQFLVHSLGIPATELGWRRKDNRVETYFLEHLLAVNDVRIDVHLAAAQQGWGCAWVDDRELRRRLQAARAAHPSRAPCTPLPDGYFTLRNLPVQTAHRRASFALEVDRGTMERGAWIDKVRAYRAWVEGGEYRRHFDTTSLRVLVVAVAVRRPSHAARAEPSLLRRLEQLVTWTAAGGGGRLFWFTTGAEATQDALFQRPIWRVPSGADRQPLIAWPTDTSPAPISRDDFCG